MSADVKGSRPYDNAGRTRRSLARQAEVVAVVARLVVADGYAGVTISRVAGEAGVSVPWLYKVFGPKPVLVKRVYDALLAGDLEDVPIAQRAETRAIAASRDLAEQVRGYAALARALSGRAGAFVSALVAAARSGDPELAGFLATIERERLTGAEIFVRSLRAAGTLPAGADPDRARDVVWLHTSPDAYRMLVLDRGWSLAAYERWFAESLLAALTGPTVRAEA